MSNILPFTRVGSDAPVYCTECARPLRLIDKLESFDPKTGDPNRRLYLVCRKDRFCFGGWFHDEWQQQDDGEWEKNPMNYGY